MVNSLPFAAADTGSIFFLSQRSKACLSADLSAVADRQAAKKSNALFVSSLSLLVSCLLLLASQAS